MLKPKTILSPVDFSEASEYALRYAIDLAKQLQAEVNILHVYQFPLFLVPESELVMPDPDFDKKCASEIQKRLDKLIERYKSDDVRVSGSLAEGVPYFKIVEAAKAPNIDLIVIGTHGHTGLTHLLVGSVAERVVRLSSVPVLTVRKPA